MRAIRRKLRSRQGASISFALLMFLVCAVISSIVIVAGTAASGRVSDMAATDQRYYAVASAAGLLRDALDGQEDVIKSATEKRTVTTYTLDDSEGTAAAPVEAMMPIEINGVQTDDVAAVDLPLLTDAACALAALPGREWTGDRTFQLAAGGFTGTAVAVKASLDPGNRRLTLDVSKGTESTSAVAGAYTLRLTFMAEVDENTRTDHELPALQIQEDQYTVTDVTTDTVTTTVRWQCTGIEKAKPVQASPSLGGEA